MRVQIYSARAVLLSHKKTALPEQHRLYWQSLDRTLNLVGTEASGTSVHMARSPVDNRLDTLNIGLPSTIGTSVGVGHLNTESHALATIITLRHSTAPPIHKINLKFTPRQALRYDTKHCAKKQALFYIFFDFFKNSVDIQLRQRYNIEKY